MSDTPSPAAERGLGTIRYNSLLKRLQVVDRGPDIAGVRRPERNQFGDGAIVPGDDEALPGLHALQKPQQMCLRFGCADFRHVASFVRPCGGA